MNKKGLFGINILLLIVIFIVGIFVGGYLVLKAQDTIKGITAFVIGGDKILCAQDVIECSDGSFVARNPDNKCEFFECSSEDNNSDVGDIVEVENFDE
ncbi:hypothetical protein COU60_05060 [Candidatus Pacearchaeota archaeon CG10_big_fil_rev_8_21_14_0_10_34_76]|nr:MAG: hypothetical protein COU60_05060 [Candidatus Pacearchaeota archaeon CG10_big_fil_rev_8_21_14_0_10_34_76]